MEKAIEILKFEEAKVGAEYRRVIYSIHYGKLIGKNEAELNEIRKAAAATWIQVETIMALITKLEAERVDA
jgi:hypothetical protein